MDNLKKQRLELAAIIVIVATALSRASGYIRETLLLSKIGANWVSDAYNTAFLLPDFMFQLLLGGALSSAFIPLLSQYIVKKDLKEGWKAIGTFINISILGMIFFCLIGSIFASQIIPLIATGFLQKEQRIQLLTISLTRILLPSSAFLMLAGFCNGILNSHHKFASASLGPIIYNVGGIVSLFLFGASSPENVRMVAFGIMGSSIMYFIYNIIVTFKYMEYYRLKMYLKNPAFIQLLKIAIPSIIASSIAQINFIVSNKYATYAISGNLTLFNTANKTWQLPLGIFAQSIGVAFLPTMSSLIAREQFEKFKEVVSKGVKSILLFAIPSAVAFLILSNPIVRTLFKFSSNFTEISVTQTGDILKFFTLALIAQSSQSIFVRAFFALNDTKTPLYIGMITIFLNYFLSKFLYNCMGVNGLALATSLSSFINVALLVIILDKKIHGLHMMNLLKFIVKVSVASLLMGGIIYILNLYIHVNILSKISQMVWLAIEIGFGIMLFSIFSIFMKIDILYDFLKIIRKKLIYKLSVKA